MFFNGKFISMSIMKHWLLHNFNISSAAGCRTSSHSHLISISKLGASGYWTNKIHLKMNNRKWGRRVHIMCVHNINKKIFVRHRSRYIWCWSLISNLRLKCVLIANASTFGPQICTLPIFPSCDATISTQGPLTRSFWSFWPHHHIESS